MRFSLSGASWQTVAAVLALPISVAAAWFTWDGNSDARQIAEQQGYEAYVDTRIAHCTSLSQSYATQSWAYGRGNGSPDPQIEEFAHKAVAIARAARLCRNINLDVTELKTCIETLVDKPVGHFVTELGSDGNSYTNLVC